MDDKIQIIELDTASPALGDYLVFQRSTGDQEVYKAPKSEIEGEDAFVYIAYADDDTGTGFTNTFNASKNYIAILSTNTEIETPIVSDFTGLWKNYKGQKGDTGDAATITIGTVATLNPEDPATVVNSGTQYAAVFNFGIPKGEKGDQGDTGNGIASIEKTSTVGFVDTYTITYTDTTTDTFNVTNGISFTPKGAYSAVTEYEANDVVSYLGSTWIALETTTGNTPQEGVYWTLNAQKGADGEGAGDMLASTYDPDSIQGDVFDMDNMVQGSTKFFVDATQISNWDDAYSWGDHSLAGYLTPATGLLVDQTTPQTTDGILQTNAALADFIASNMYVNKEYVDSVISFQNTFFFNDTASDIVGIYYKMLDEITGEVESSFVSGSLPAGNGQSLYNFATDPGVPGVTMLKHGVYSAHIHAKKASAGGKAAQIYFEIYTRTTGGVETLRATSEISELLTTTKTEYDLHATITSDVEIGITDRIIIKWKANIGVTGTDAIITLYAENANASRLAIPTTTEVLSTVFIRQDGTKPLTGNWDAGAYNITANEFIGDLRRPVRSGTFALGDTTYQKNDATVTANSIIDVYAQSAPVGAWTVESYSGYFIITSTKTETSNVDFKYFINNV